jgi:oligopeptidase B
MTHQISNLTGSQRLLTTPPVAKQLPVISSLHGEDRTDNYAWMRNRQDPDLIPHLDAENAYTDAYMRTSEALQETLYQEMRSRIKEADTSAPAKRGKYLYYERTEAGKQYKKICRRLDKPKSKEQIVLDLDGLARQYKFFELGAVAYSKSGNFIAYTIDTTGYRQYTLVVKNLRTKRTLSTTAERVTSVVWANDNKTLLYTTEDATTKRSNLAYRHTIGQKKHHLLFEESDELFELSVDGMRSGAFIYLESSSHTTSQSSYLDANTPKGAFKPLMPRKAGVRYIVEDDGKDFYILTNENAKNFRLVKVSCLAPEPANWQEIIAHRENVLLAEVDLFANHLVVQEKHNGLMQIRIQDQTSGVIQNVSFPEPVYEVVAAQNFEFDTTMLRLSYQSLVTPPSTFACDMNSGALTLLKSEEIIGYDPSQYKCERVFAEAADGTKVPMSLVYKGELVKDASRNLHAYGYGAYGFGVPADFRQSRLSLLNRGFIFVINHIRGGNDLGEGWHEQGKMAMKMNTFTDFIACLKHLIDGKYTTAKKMSIEGRSAGGLLMGAVLNLRSDLFNAAIVGVPFLDVINTMLDETLPLTVGEFEEWGNPKVKAEYVRMKEYSPYDNLSAKDYAAMLVKSAIEDSQVGYWEPAKYVAKLRTLKTDKNPLLLKMLMEAGGHGGVSGRFDYLREIAFDQAFILMQMGITE